MLTHLTAHFCGRKYLPYFFISPFMDSLNSGGSKDNIYMLERLIKEENGNNKMAAIPAKYKSLDWRKSCGETFPKLCKPSNTFTRKEVGAQMLR